MLKRGADRPLNQRAVIVKAAHDPATLAYDLGKNNARCVELAKNKDPINLNAAVARL